jgi:hypothetical protein
MKLPGVAGGDSLTRTTLRFGGPITESLGAELIGSLHRVPGVLMATMDPATLTAMVAHDGAVPTTSLVAAAAQAGVVAVVVRAGAVVKTPASEAIAPAKRLSRTLLIVAPLLAIAFTLLFAEMVLPEMPQKRLLVNALVLGVWIIFFARMYVRKGS